MTKIAPVKSYAVSHLTRTTASLLRFRNSIRDALEVAAVKLKMTLP